jgi:ribosomal protein S18 acetylase RimI-like enzyme
VSASQHETINVREATVADCYEVAVVNVRSWRESFRGIVPQAALDRMDYRKRADAFAERFEQKAGAGDDDFYQMLVAELPGPEVVGYVDFGPPRETSYGQFAAELYSIYVLKEHQGRGVGGRLFRAMAASLAARGLRSVFLVTLEASPYRHFYERVGGRVLGRGMFEIGGAQLVESAYGWDDLLEHLNG